LHLAREAPWYMMRLAGQAQHRRSRLNSNVRPHMHRQLHTLRRTLVACGLMFSHAAHAAQAIDPIEAPASDSPSSPTTIKGTNAGPQGSKPTIKNLASCAPKADDYPIESVRRNETGTTELEFTVAPNGRLSAFGVSRSSGHLALDFIALGKLASCRFDPAKADDGTPISATMKVQYVWRIE
jgi:TonB family protein